MTKENSQSGFGIIGIISLLGVLVIAGGIGWLAYSNILNKKPSTAASVKSSTSPKPTPTPSSIPDAYSGWQTYTNSAVKYTLRYPPGWKFDEAKPGEITSAIASVSFTPPNAKSAVVTISTFKSTKTPKDLINPTNSLPIIDSNETSINGGPTYYAKYGDSTYVNLQYAISHSGLINTVTMTETSSTLKEDNFQYVDQFDLIAKSVKF